METRRRNFIVIGVIRKAVVKAEASAKIAIVVAVAATTKTMSAQERDQAQMMIVLSMEDISGASAIRIFELAIANLERRWQRWTRPRQLWPR